MAASGSLFAFPSLVYESIKVNKIIILRICVIPQF